jgi:hypothetical protein
VKAEISTALIPVQLWDQTLKPIARSGMVPYRQDDHPRGEMRFLGYGEGADSNSYSRGGREATGPQQGMLVDLYI